MILNNLSKYNPFQNSVYLVQYNGTRIRSQKSWYGIIRSNYRCISVADAVDIVITPPEVDKQIDEDVNEDFQMTSTQRDLPATTELHYEQNDKKYSSEDEKSLPELRKHILAHKKDTAPSVWTIEPDTDISKPPRRLEDTQIS